MKVYAINSRGVFVPFKKKAAGVVLKRGERIGKFGVCFSLTDTGGVQTTVVSPGAGQNGGSSGHFGDKGQESKLIQSFFRIESFAGKSVTTVSSESGSEGGFTHDKGPLFAEPVTPQAIKGDEPPPPPPPPDNSEVSSKSVQEMQQDQGQQQLV
jgi:hypothetical protein